MAIIVACGGNSEEKKTEIANKDVQTDSLISGIDRYKDSLSTLNLPEGFEISIYAEVENARSMALSESGTLFVGNRDRKSVV